jgi:hypothetical protein
MDAEKRVIPIVEDDQGEGIKDPLDKFDVEDQWSLEKFLDDKMEKEKQERYAKRFKR